MEEFVPSAAIAHFVMKVKDVESSYAFYQGLGLRGIDNFRKWQSLSFAAAPISC